MIGTAPAKRPRRPRPPPALVPGALNFKRFVVVTCIGAVAGLVLPSLGPLREPVLVLAFFGLCARLVIAIALRQFTFAWGLSAYLCALEPAFRSHAPVLPYLALDYVLLICGALTFLLSRPRKAARALPAIAYGVYIALEISGSVSADSMSAARGIVVPSLCMLMFVMNAGRTRLTPSGTTFVLASYIAGAATLATFALRTYLSNDITWGTQSNLEASGGMPPNHMSVLLSVAVFACIVLAEQARRTQRIMILGVATALGFLMVLTFSRGGTAIVLVALVLYYVVLRQTNRKTIFAMFAIAVMGLLISYGTSEITGGKVADRYGRSDTSNRFTIVVQGWGIYLEHPVLGVGTSNFREAMTETRFARVTGAHNELIRAAAEHGTVGLITWLLFIGSAFIVALRDGEPHRARRGLRVVIFVFATTSMFYNGLKLTVQPMLVLLALSSFTAAEPAPAPRKRPALT
jgi:O-antigen ligase